MYNLPMQFSWILFGIFPEKDFEPAPPPQKCVYQIVQFKLCDLHIGNLVHITFTLFDMDSFDGKGMEGPKMIL